MYALQKMDYYLNGVVFTIKTDHNQLQYLLEADQTNKKIQQWALKLSGYKIEYLADRDNTHADLLSRIPKQLKAESVRMEPEVNGRAYQLRLINSNRLGNCLLLESDTEEITQLVTGIGTCI